MRFAGYRLHHLLKPGEEVEFNRVKLKFLPKSAGHFGGMHLKVAIGESYRTSLTLDLPQGGQMTKDIGFAVPAKDEWVGELQTGVVAFEIVGQRLVDFLPRENKPAKEIRTPLEMLKKLNRRNLEQNADQELNARIEMYEKAYRLQTALAAIFEKVEKAADMKPEDLAKALEEVAKATDMENKEGYVGLCHQSGGEHAHRIQG